MGQTLVYKILAGHLVDGKIAGIRIGQVVIGSCSNSGFADLMTTAKILRGRRINTMVEFAAAPGSRGVLNMLAENAGHNCPYHLPTKGL